MLGRLFVIAALATGCYSIPAPDCGFSCGPGNSCPADYTCAPDNICHHTGFTGTCASRSDAGTDATVNFMVQSTTPADGATGVPVDQVIKAMVDRDVDGVTDGTFYLMDGPTAVLATASYDLGAFALHLVPALQLLPNTAYTVVIGAGIHSFHGTDMLVPLQWSFMTGADTVAPHLTSSMPFDGEASVPTTTTIQINFDEPVTGVDTTSFTVNDLSTPVLGTIAMFAPEGYQFTPTAPLAAATTYMVSLSSAIQDASGNALAPITFSFTTP